MSFKTSNSMGFKHWAASRVVRQPYETKGAWISRAWLIYKSELREGEKVAEKETFAIFGKTFKTRAEMEALWNTLMLVLDKKLYDSGLDISHKDIPTQMLIDWVGQFNSHRSLSLGMKDYHQWDAFIDDEWNRLYELQKTKATTQLVGPVLDAGNLDLFPKPKLGISSAKTRKMASIERQDLNRLMEEPRAIRYQFIVPDIANPAGR